jgi:hypothetical protein
VTAVQIVVPVSGALAAGLAGGARPHSVPDDVCAGLPGPAAFACQAADGVANGLSGGFGGVVGGAAQTAVWALAHAFAEAGKTFLGKLGELLGATTQVDVSSDWFLKRYAVMFGISALLTFVLLLLSVLKSVVRGQAMDAIRSATLYYIAAVTASAFAPAFVYLLLQLSDQLCVVLAMGAEEDVERFLTGATVALGTAMSANAGVGPAALLVAALATVFCAGVLWVELLLRTAIIYVSLLFAAPTFSGLVDRGLWKHARRWVYFTVSVIFAKPVVVAVLALAASGASAGGPEDAFTSIFVSLALLIVAIFCVGLLFKLVPNAGDEIAGALSARRELTSATPNSPVPGPGIVVRQSVQSHLVRSATRATTGVTAGAATAPVAAVSGAGIAAHRTVGAAARAATSSAGAAASSGGGR